MDTKDKNEYQMRPQTPEEKDRNNQEDQDIPAYHVKLNLSEDEQVEFSKAVFDEFEALKTEREELKLAEKWESLDRQYDGDVKSNQNLAFNLHVHQSKIKADAICRAMNEAFLDSDPMFDCTPRPESARNDGYKVAERQAQFLDFVVDEEICPEPALTKIFMSATRKFVGIAKLSWAYMREKRRREECYEGKNVPVAVTPNGQVVVQNEGLERFLKAYPDAMEKQKGIIKRLLNESKVEIVVEFKDTIDNNAKIQHIKVENFYVRNACEYWLGLRTEHIVVERQQYTYWELMKKQDSGEFENVDRVFMSSDGKDADPNCKTKSYDVLEVTTYYKPAGESEEIKVKAWFGEDHKVFLAAEVFPYYGFDIDYVPFYLKLNDDGFYGGAKSVMYDLRDSNIAQNALLNLALQGTLARNTLTPIVREGSDIEQMFLDHTFTFGKPLAVDELTDDVSKEFSFVQWPNADMNSSLVLMEKLKRIDGDVTRVSDLTTGQESELDPSAPASKTIALLQQSGIGIKDYIRTSLPSFNVLASMILQLYYQMSTSGEKKYKVMGKASAVTGQNPFETISREEMIVKTNIQSRAASFAFDKMNEKKEAIAAHQIISSSPYAMQQPQLQYKSLKTLLETLGDRWRAIVDTDLESPEEFQQKMQNVALQAMAALIEQAGQQSKATGIPVNPKELMQAAPNAIAKAQMLSFNPSLAEENPNGK